MKKVMTGLLAAALLMAAAPAEAMVQPIAATSQLAIMQPIDTTAATAGTEVAQPELVAYRRHHHRPRHYRRHYRGR